MKLIGALIGILALLSVYAIMTRNTGSETTLSVFCGAGLRPPIAEMIGVFEKETGAKVEPTYGASNLLLGQLKLTQRGDIFIPGDEFYVEQAQAENLVDESHTVAYFIPVIMVQKGNPLGIHELSDLIKPGVRIGLADERAAAIGRVARMVIEKSGVEIEAVEKNLVFTSTTVHELGDALKLGHIDASIVWSAVAKQYEDAADIVPIPQTINVPVPIPAAVISNSENRTAAREFIDFMISERGEEIFRKHYYDTTIPQEGIE